MKTPICDFVAAYAASSPIRMHMPGHKGVGDGCRCDLTEIVGADCLFTADGIIKESEDNLSTIYGADSFYSTEGSSLSIRTALYLVTLFARENGKRPLILAARNAHRSFISSAILVDFELEWLDTGREYLTADIDPETLEARLSREDAPVAVYITSPDYLGAVTDVSRIAGICHAHDTLLLVDNAHGAYLKFLSPSRHPIDLGADIVVDSAHKTLPVLTGSGYLHLSHSLPEFFKNNLKDAMALFASTSPSYLILESMDRLNPYLDSEFSCDLQRKVCKIEEIKQKLRERGFTLIGDEPMKITLRTKPIGYWGDELAALLAESGIYVEFFDRDYLTLMPSTMTEDDELEAVLDVLLKVEPRKEILDEAPKLPRAVRITSPREAAMSPSVTLPLKECVGRVLAETSVSCPPAVPILVSGELITEESISAFAYYGITELKVLADKR